MRKILTLLLTIILFLSFSSQAYAVTDPLKSPNNRFGIHILNESDLEAASKLVNSSGGEWGYVTLVIQQNDLKLDKWQRIFDELRKQKLIPLVRLATYPENDYWVKPKLADIDQWVEFLNSLNWVVKNRYLILFNEPNHKKEWGNDINPSEYATISHEFIQKLKNQSDDYFILPAGFDTAAPNSQSTMKATDYWQQMFVSDPQIFTLFDGWNSHSYPNPNFSGPVTGTGLGSLQSYRFEVQYLTRFNLSADLPVFITETGWIHQDGNVLGASTTSDALSSFYQSAFQNIWQDQNLVAITPFVLNYPQPPFDQFSWQKADASFYPHYYAVKDLKKTKGNPEQLHLSQIISHNLPDKLVDNSDYQFFVDFKNIGQSIWNRRDFYLKVTPSNDAVQIFTSHLNETKPFKSSPIFFNLKTLDQDSSVDLALQLYYLDQPFGPKMTHTLSIIPPPNLIVKAKRLFKLNQDSNYQLLIYDQEQNLKNKFSLSLDQGVSQPLKLYNLVPNQIYRFVLLKPFYLPRQIIAHLTEQPTEIIFKNLLPLDLDQNGHFNFQDIIYGLIHPVKTFKIYCLWC